MRRWLTVMALAALAACAGPPSAVRTAADAAHKAADAFAAKAAASPGNPPRQTDPTVAPLLNAVFDTAPLQGAAPAWGDVDAVNDWLASALKVGEVYMLAGTGVSDISAVGGNAAAQARIGQNTATYGPEMGRFIDAELAIEGAEAASVLQHMAATPNAAQDATFAKGLDTTRGGYAQTALGVIQTVGDATMPNAWREARAQALVAFAGRAGPLLTDAQRSQLAQAATATAAIANDPQLATLLGQFATAISTKA